LKNTHNYQFKDQTYQYILTITSTFSIYALLSLTINSTFSASSAPWPLRSCWSPSLLQICNSFGLEVSVKWKLWSFVLDCHAFYTYIVVWATRTPASRDMHRRMSQATCVMYERAAYGSQSYNLLGLDFQIQLKAH
jgi:hypothetical protein